EANEVKAERAVKHHDPLALVARTQTAPQYHYSLQPSSTQQPYYVSHLADEEENQIFDFHNDESNNLVENLNKAMMLLARKFTMSYAIPTNNRVITSSNTRNQVAIRNSRTSSRGVGNTGFIPRVLVTTGIGTRNVGNMLKCYNCNEKGHFAKDYSKLMFKDSNYFKEQVLLAKKDKAGIDLTEKKNDFLVDVMLDEELDEFNAKCIKMARIQETTNID
nr:hypothetical protein [Tanacetum cinerariifolium]